MSWFTKKKEGEIKEELPALPDFIEDNGSNALMYNDVPNEASETSELPMLPQIRADEIPQSISSQNIARELGGEVRNFMNEPKPGMQKSRFSPAVPIGFEPKQPVKIPQGIEQFRQVQKTPSYKNVLNQETGFARPSSSFKPSIKSLLKKDEPVYIRLDKFQLTIDAFREIREKIREIENLLAKTREIKSREEKEIEEWEREIEAIKIKIESIDKEMFEQSN